ncbi:hypothetical protein [Mycolicibacterium thermoresistibile]
MIQNQHDDRDRAALLSITAGAAMVVAYLLTFSVLTDTNLAARFANGVAPGGTDLAGNRVAVVAGIVAALGAWTAAGASRKVGAVVTVLVASVPFALLSLIAVALAF